jgi:hypothetical protein
MRNEEGMKKVKKKGFKVQLFVNVLLLFDVQLFDYRTKPFFFYFFKCRCYALTLLCQRGDAVNYFSP